MATDLAHAGSLTTQAPESRPQDAARPAPQDDLENLRRALQQPGAGARSEREGAVDALLLRRDLLAHQVLARTLRDGDDPDGRGRFVLDNVARKLAQPADPVFGDERVRVLVLPAWIDAIALLFVEGDNPPVPSSTPELRDLAMRCVRALSFKERRTELDRVAASRELTTVRAALRIAGRSRDLGLGAWLAERLTDPDLVVAARQALAELTFVEEPFVDKAAFDTWFFLNKSADYVQLAEDAARRANDAVRRVRDDLQGQFVTQTARLVAAMARAENPDWKSISAETLRTTPASLTVACLRALRDALGDRAVTSKLGGIVSDRQEFARALRELLARSDERPADYALVLETMAYLAVKDDATQRGLTEERLVAALQRPDAEIRRAALRGLRRFPSPANREAVLAAIDAALASGDVLTDVEALACISSASWSAPEPAAPERAHWVSTLGHVLETPGLDATLAERALQVAVMRDSAGNLVDELFPVLIAVAANAQRDGAARRLVAQRMVAFARDDERADRYFDLVVGMLDDSDVNLRRFAAAQLGSMPDVGRTRREAWDLRVVAASTRRLAVETDEVALRELCARLLSDSEQEVLAESVIQGFAAAVHTVAADPQAAGAETRRKVLADSLKVLGSVRTRKLAEWVVAGKALQELRAREELRKLLEQHDITNQPLTEPRDPALVDALQLVIAAARLEKSTASWRGLPEAEEVRRAFDLLEKCKVAITAPADIELRLRVLRDLDRGVELATAVRTALQIPGLPVETRVNVLIAGINNDLRDGSLPADLDDADRLLRDLDQTGSVNGRSLDLWSTLARRRFDAGDVANASRIAGDVLARTAADAPSWRERFLFSMETRVAATDTTAREPLLLELRARADQFGGETAHELTDRYHALLKTCGG
ncbi:MAG: hypothetical protein U1F36_11245 [Planctomycetota bacterium]